MKVKTLIKGEDEFIFAELKEVQKEELKLAFEDVSPNGMGKIFLFNNKLWRKAKCDISISTLYEERSCALNDLIYKNQNFSTYTSLSYYNENITKEEIIAKVHKDLSKYILVDNELYTITYEPIYIIYTYGIGGNTGGTELRVVCSDDSNDVGSSYVFSALEVQNAIFFANDIAQKRGDTNNVGKFAPLIICYIPELVTFNGEAIRRKHQEEKNLLLQKDEKKEKKEKKKGKSKK